MLALLLFVSRWLLFWLDEWAFILLRSDPSLPALLAPHVDHFVAVPVMVYEVLLGMFGLRAYLPYLLVDWVAHAACVALLYRIVARRSGPVVGTAAGISVLFLGSGWEVLLHPFQMQYLFAAAGGLLAIDRLDAPNLRQGAVVIAAIALVLAVASSGLGVILAGLILVWGVARRNVPTILAVAPATAVYAMWYFTWGAERSIVPGPGLSAWESVFAVTYGIGAAISGLIGLPPAQFAVVGLAVGVAAVGLIGVSVKRGYRPDPLAVAALAALLAEHVLQTALRAPLGVEHGSRSAYVYPGVIFLWLVITGLLQRRLPGHRAVPIVVGIVLLVMVVGNMRQLVGAARGARDLRATELAELELIDAMRGDPTMRLDASPDEAILSVNLTPRRYLAAIDRFGRPSLGFDWRPAADQDEVELARRRLIGLAP